MPRLFVSFIADTHKYPAFLIVGSTVYLIPSVPSVYEYSFNFGLRFLNVLQEKTAGNKGLPKVGLKW